MKPNQKRKLVGWCSFYVALPVLVYPAAALIATFSGVPFTLQEALVKGDLLFLVVILLATTVDWTAHDMLLTPKRVAMTQWFNYFRFTVLLLALVFYTLIYGWVITTRLSGAPPIANPEMVMWFCGASLLGWGICCGLQYARLLQLGRI